jgi:signal transduction histidine kinase
MFKKLKVRFLFLHMGIVTLLVLLFFGSVLLINYTGLERSTDERLNMSWFSRFGAGGENAAFWAGTTEPADGGPENAAPREAYGYGAPPLDSGAPFGFYVSSSDDSPEMSVSVWEFRPRRMGLDMMMNNAILITVDENNNVAEVESPYTSLDASFYAYISGAVPAGAESRGKLTVGEVVLKYQAQDYHILAIDVTAESEMFGEMRMSFLLIALPLLAMIFLLSLFFANRAIRPIEQSFNRQKEFIADASHELKTPLAAITTNLEAAHSAEGPDRQKWLGYIKSEVERMSELTGSLLYLAKMDRADAGSFLPVSLDTLLQDVLLPLEALIFEKGLQLETAAETGVTVPGDAEQLRKLIAILAENALRYAHKSIWITLQKHPHHAVLAVENDGPGIPEADREKIWDRFYRCDPSRKYDGGSGLGLPMARAIAERHQGKIACESNETRTVFTVRLPLGE